MLNLDKILEQIEKARAENKNNYPLPVEADKPEIKESLKKMGFWIIKNQNKNLVYWK